MAPPSKLISLLIPGLVGQQRQALHPVNGVQDALVGDLDISRSFFRNDQEPALYLERGIEESLYRYVSAEDCFESTMSACRLARSSQAYGRLFYSIHVADLDVAVNGTEETIGTKHHIVRDVVLQANKKPDHTMPDTIFQCYQPIDRAPQDMCYLILSIILIGMRRCVEGGTHLLQLLLS